MAGYQWTWDGDVSAHVAADTTIDSELAAILLTAADRDRDRRYQSVREMCAALAAYLEGIWPGRSAPAAAP
jgi:hypothetical protein